MAPYTRTIRPRRPAIMLSTARPRLLGVCLTRTSCDFLYVETRCVLWQRNWRALFPSYNVVAPKEREQSTCSSSFSKPRATLCLSFTHSHKLSLIVPSSQTQRDVELHTESWKCLGQLTCLCEGHKRRCRKNRIGSRKMRYIAMLLRRLFFGFLNGNFAFPTFYVLVRVRAC